MATEMSNSSTIAHVLCSQLPFLDPGCEVNRLLAAVVATRYHRAGEHRTRPATDIEHWLAPESACQLLDGSPDHLAPLDYDQQAMVAFAIDSAVAMRPQWRTYFELPVRFRLLPADSPAISASAPHWPQHIMLAPAAFATLNELREQVVHEFCHQWMYLLEEVCPLERTGSTRDLVLPSGTSERSPREILGAAHVGIALSELYTADPAAAPAHLDVLSTYTRGCLDLAAQIEDLLTDEGIQLARRMKGRLHP